MIRDEEKSHADEGRVESRFTAETARVMHVRECTREQCMRDEARCVMKRDPARAPRQASASMYAQASVGRVFNSLEHLQRAGKAQGARGKLQPPYAIFQCYHSVLSLRLESDLSSTVESILSGRRGQRGHLC